MIPNIIEKLIIWSSIDGGDTWSIVDPKDVPGWIQGEAIIRRLSGGEGAQAPGGDTWYIATRPPKMPSSINVH